MMNILDLRGEELTVNSVSSQLPRPSINVRAAVTDVEPLLAAVASEGEAALRDQALRFDGVSGHSLRVSLGERNAALKATDADVVIALKESIRRLRLACANQLLPEVLTDIAPGATIVQRWQPVSRVGLYVPGGKAVYPSSVVMNVVPAQVAGVEHIALASPAQKEFGGSVHPTILAAATLLDITEIYAIGGAGAIGAFAFGVDAIGLDAVDVITGPGNVYVAAAKRLVNGEVGIDSEAGTTEILVIADDQANPRYVAADLISQAEHDEAAAAILVTDSAVLAEAVNHEIEALVAVSSHAERIRIALEGPQSRIVLVDTLEDAALVSNAYAPEHLELQVRSVDSVLQTISNAGVIFMGQHTPVALGDYIAGSNHVLPTGGSARFASGLGVHTFLRAQQVVKYSAEALKEVSHDLSVLANAENLPAHAESVRVRWKDL